MRLSGLSKKHSRGLTLVELMISLVIGLFLIGGISSVYLAAKRSSAEVERMARMSQNSRLALQILSDALIHAGYTGELAVGNIIKDTNLGSIAGTDCIGKAAAYDINNYLVVATADGNGDALGCITDALPLTPVLMIKSVRPMKLLDSTSDGIIDYPEPIIGKNTYIIANNNSGILFDGADKPPSITIGGDIPGGNAWLYQAQIYYIRDKGIATPQLCRKVLAWNGKTMALVTEELVEDIENMRFLFGVDTNADGNVDKYSNAKAVTNWNNISSVEIYILVRSSSPDFQYEDNKTYNLADLPPIVAPADNFHRQVMQTTLSLPNPSFAIRSNL